MLWNCRGEVIKSLLTSALPSMTFTNTSYKKSKYPESIMLQGNAAIGRSQLKTFS